jgi:ubiquinone/menaquinone biosynthesis C-methylase UbiE
MDDDLPNYSDPAYWEMRYKKEHGTYDWYLEWNEFLQQHLTSLGVASPVLVVGCGNSTLSMELESSGIFPVVLIDISRTCCQKMSKMFGGTYISMDVCKMQFRNNSFQYIIDKGTLDALVCHPHYEIAVAKMMAEISRVLAPNGVFIETTFRETAKRIHVLDSPKHPPSQLLTQFRNHFPSEY